jgi:hypothetical protein
MEGVGNASKVLVEQELRSEKNRSHFKRVTAVEPTPSLKLERGRREQAKETLHPSVW